MTDTSKIAEAIINALRYRDVKPDGEFTSASGINHGTVESWTISDGKSVVAYGNNAQTDYEISDYTTEDDNLSAWLLADGLGINPLDRISTLGVVGISQVGADYAEPVKVIYQRHMYDNCGNGDTFACLAPSGATDWDSATIYANATEALAAIEEDCPSDELYRLGHNEHSRPTYYIVADEG